MDRKGRGGRRRKERVGNLLSKPREGVTLDHLVLVSLLYFHAPIFFFDACHVQLLVVLASNKYYSLLPLVLPIVVGMVRSAAIAYCVVPVGPSL